MCGVGVVRFLEDEEGVAEPLLDDFEDELEVLDELVVDEEEEDEDDGFDEALEEVELAVSKSCNFLEA